MQKKIHAICKVMSDTDTRFWHEAVVKAKNNSKNNSKHKEKEKKDKKDNKSCDGVCDACDVKGEKAVNLDSLLVYFTPLNTRNFGSGVRKFEMTSWYGKDAIDEEDLAGAIDECVRIACSNIPCHVDLTSGVLAT